MPCGERPARDRVAGRTVPPETTCSGAAVLWRIWNSDRAGRTHARSAGAGGRRAFCFARDVGWGEYHDRRRIGCGVSRAVRLAAQDPGGYSAMMDVFSLLGHGFVVAATPMNLFFCLGGAVCGTLIGVLPGLGPVATISLLFPATFALDPLAAIIMLSGIYYGAQYGGSTTAILVNIPGESTSVVTAIDGYKMAQQGRAGEALAIAAIGSFIAGCIGTLVIAVAGPPLALMTQKFASPDYFSLMVLGLVSAGALAYTLVVRALSAIPPGLLPCTGRH